MTVKNHMLDDRLVVTVTLHVSALKNDEKNLAHCLLYKGLLYICSRNAEESHIYGLLLSYHLGRRKALCNDIYKALAQVRAFLFIG